MFRAAYRLPFKLLGIPVRLDISFLLILPLIAWLIGAQIEPYVRLFNEVFGHEIDPRALQTGNTPFFLGLVAAIGLFAGVVLHELGHAATAKRFGVKTKEITLWFLGGLAQLDEIPRQKGAEAIVAIAGPLTSLLVAGVSWSLWSIIPQSAHAAQFVLGYLTYMNAFLAIFNLFPALPLDGGRVLRSLLALFLDYLKATRIAAFISQGLAVLLSVYGFYTFNVFLMVLAFFIYSAVRGETQYAIISQALGDLRVRELMTREVISVTPDMNVGQLMQMMFFHKHLGYPVVTDAGELVGFVKLSDAREVRDDIPVREVMSQEVPTIADTAEAMEAFKRISEGDIGRLVVTDPSGKMIGILSKTDLIRAIQLRSATPQQGDVPR